MRKPSLSGLTKKLDKLFSEFIRRRAADRRGLTQCVSCGARKPWKEMQAGHYVKRSNRSVRWDCRNVHPQCVACNVFKNGNYANYTKYLLDTYGGEWLKKLITDGNKIVKFSVIDLQAKIDEIKVLLKTL